MFRSLSYQSHPIKPQEFPGKAIAAQLHLLPGGCITRRVQTQIFLHLQNHQGVAWMFVGVSLNGGTPKSSILIGFSIINHSILGVPLFLETPRKLVPLMICSVLRRVWVPNKAGEPQVQTGFVCNLVMPAFWRPLPKLKGRPCCSKLNMQACTLSDFISCSLLFEQLNIAYEKLCGGCLMSDMWRSLYMFYYATVVSSDAEHGIKRLPMGIAYIYIYIIYIYMGVSLNGGTPKTPQNDHF